MAPTSLNVAVMTQRQSRVVCAGHTRLRCAVVALVLTLPGCRDAAAPSTPSPAPGVGTNAAPVISRPAPQEFVGSQVCAECHADQFETYRHTAHSRSLSLVDAANEPPDGEFKHPKSGRSYRAYREQGRMRHREWIAAEQEGDVIAADHPVTYLVGSGRHSRTYLVEADSFLVESPITWYASRNAWDLSPGYDVPEPPSFERPADMGCLACHVGRAAAIDGSFHRIAFDELAIGCERCHGAGAAHVAYQRRAKDGTRPDAADPIVHPGKLSRELAESICAQCHLRGDATVFLPGVGPMDFQPGQSLSSVRIDYRPARPVGQMEVVGHVEQMWLSRCYTESTTLTCVTCHDMHAAGAPENAEELYRSKCLNCHTPAACGLQPDDAERTSREDNCLACHMPQTETDIPHIAFTHHRIGVHVGRDEPASAPRAPVQLIPMADTQGLDRLLRERCLALAYLEFAERQGNPAVRQSCQEQAMQLIDGLSRKGSIDGELLAGLARVYWEHRPDLAVETAQQALDAGALSAGAAVNAWFVIGDTLFHSRQPDAARPALEQLTRRRRNSEDWLLLGLCRHRSGQAGAPQELKQAQRISPFRSDIRQLINDLSAP